jgi:hypothetical protein
VDNLRESDVSSDGAELRVTVGMRVTVEIREQKGKVERLVFDLVPDKESNFSSGLVSERAPLAQAILGRLSGETVQYLAPSGSQQIVTVLSIEPSGIERSRPASNRDQVLGEVQDRIARRESRQIALTTELHYGSIDPDGIKEE